jgi:hypothetical protein
MRPEPAPSLEGNIQRTEPLQRCLQEAQRDSRHHVMASFGQNCAQPGREPAVHAPPFPYSVGAACGLRLAFLHSHDVKQQRSFPRRRSARSLRVLAAPNEGRRSAERRKLGRAGEARRAPCHRCTRLLALCLGDFRLRVGASGPGISSGRACSELLAARVLVPGGRVPCLPSAAVTSRGRRTPISLRLRIVS